MMYPSSAGPALAGQVVVFGGRLAALGRRDALALVEQLGGHAAGDITHDTTLLVLGGAAGPADADYAAKLQRVEEMNARTPGRVRVISEAEFCRLAGIDPDDRRRRQFYEVRDIRSLYPTISENHLRYLERWSLIRPLAGTTGNRLFAFSDLATIRQLAAELERGVPLKAALRGLLAAREGQMTFDFHASGSATAKVLALPPRDTPRSNRPGLAAVAPRAPFPDPQLALAAKYFVEGSRMDDGDEQKMEDAAAAYRKALVIDPDLVPAIVNLANIHYARDELIEAQALYERAIGLDPECFEAHFNLGNIHHDLGRYDEALVCYRDAVALNPRYADAHFYLAVTLEKTGHSPEAKPHWKTYQDLAPNGEWVELAREFSE
jgi:tetratricopeptide (TPR) repeat protein